jgi:cytochrome c oxidase subunit II
MEKQFQLMPEQASTMAPRIDALFWFIVAVCAFFTVLIAILLITFAVRYRRVSEDFFPTPLVGSRILEFTWSGIPLCLVMVMFFWGLFLYFDYARTPDNSLDVYVTGKQWMWHLQHPGGQREINTLHVPAGRTVKLIMTSEDVIHDFYVPAFRVKADVLPGKYTYLWFEATKPGTYHLFCAQYCGTDHSRMIGSVVVMKPEDYEEWLAGHYKDGKGQADRSLALQGRQLFQKLQCVTCHHPEAGNRAPNLVGLYNRQVELETGRFVTADDTYIRESILYPAEKVRAGWRPIMPTFKGQVDENDLIRLVAYVKSLKPGDELPPRVEYAASPDDKTQEKDKGKKPDEKKPDDKKDKDKKDKDKDAKDKDKGEKDKKAEKDKDKKAEKDKSK